MMQPRAPFIVCFVISVGVAQESRAATGPTVSPLIDLKCTRNERRYPEPREALVIGNSAYTEGGGWTPLKDAPVKDAEAMAARLCGLGFSVSLATDVTADQFKLILGHLEDSGLPNQARTRLFYYSGHGVERDGTNYLIPIDVGQDQVGRRGVRLRDVFWALDPVVGGRISIRKLVFLDACRSDKARFNADGFRDPADAPAGALVSYATAPYASASLLGRNGHSLFTGALLHNIGEAGESLASLLSRVRTEVYEASGHLQTPWETGSVVPEFKFTPDLRIEQVAVRIPIADDLVLLEIDGRVAARQWREQEDHAWKAIDPALLHPGRNAFAVYAYNDKTFTNNNPVFGSREGWRVRFEIKIEDRAPRCWDFGVSEATRGKDWGQLFSVWTGVIAVDPEDGRVTLTSPFVQSCST